MSTPLPFHPALLCVKLVYLIGLWMLEQSYGVVMAHWNWESKCQSLTDSVLPALLLTSHNNFIHNPQCSVNHL